MSGAPSRRLQDAPDAQVQAVPFPVAPPINSNDIADWMSLVIAKHSFPIQTVSNQLVYGYQNYSLFLAIDLYSKNLITLRNRVYAAFPKIKQTRDVTSLRLVNDIFNFVAMQVTILEALANTIVPQYRQPIINRLESLKYFLPEVAKVVSGQILSIQ